MYISRYSSWIVGLIVRRRCRESMRFFSFRGTVAFGVHEIDRSFYGSPRGTKTAGDGQTVRPSPPPTCPLLICLTCRPRFLSTLDAFFHLVRRCPPPPIGSQTVRTAWPGVVSCIHGYDRSEMEAGKRALTTSARYDRTTEKKEEEDENLSNPISLFMNKFDEMME